MKVAGALRRGRLAGLAVLAAALVAGLVPAAAGDPEDFGLTKEFRRDVTVKGIREHQRAWQDIADANGGIRASGTPGFDASAQYVVDRMTAAGYVVTRQPFDFAFFEELATPELDQVSPTPTVYVHGVDFSTMDYSGSGDVTANIQAVDVVVPMPQDAPASTSNSGCEDEDFAGFVAGNIALMQRGTCTFGEKAVNAAEAGAVGAMIFNEGQAPLGRDVLLLGTLGGPVVSFPVTGLPYALGESLVNQLASGPVSFHMFTSTISEIRSTENVIAETPGGSSEHVVVVGAHLDSVTAGPGINDNGSGSGTILEIAEVFAEQGHEPTSKLRFMWYGAEENNLLGSDFYVSGLSAEELEDIELMLNFDMVGSPNFVRFVYDGDNSTGQGAEGPPGSAEIEALFGEYFDRAGLAHEPTPFNGRSDYGPFIAAGVPAGGLFTGAEGEKSEEQAAVYGGLAGVAYDPCYHQACDTFAGTGDKAGATPPGLGLVALGQMSDAAAHLVLVFAMRDFDEDPIADEEAPPGRLTPRVARVEGRRAA
jgi:Zn-dependent M28 family amino/carboxypeptidase